MGRAGKERCVIEWDSAGGCNGRRTFTICTIDCLQ